MARYTGPSCRLCRREGTKLYLKGERCLTGKCAVARRAGAPGQHGAQNKKLKEYGMQLREKQKAKRIYGVQEKQFKNLFAKADRKEGQTGENLLILLERRLDNTVFRMGMAENRIDARQLVTAWPLYPERQKSHHSFHVCQGWRCDCCERIQPFFRKNQRFDGSVGVP